VLTSEGLWNKECLRGRTPSKRQGVELSHPFNESKEVVAGYFHIMAEDIDAAVAIAKENPIFNDLPTKIEVHPMMPIGGE